MLCAQQARQMATVAPKNTTSRADIEWNKTGPQTTLLMPLSDLTVSVTLTILG